MPYGEGSVKVQGLLDILEKILNVVLKTMLKMNTSIFSWSNSKILSYKNCLENNLLMEKRFVKNLTVNQA